MYSVNLQLEAGKTNLYLCSCMYVGMALLRENKMGCWHDWSCDQIKDHTVLQSLQEGDVTGVSSG